MKFDQDLCLNLQYNFGKMNSTLGSVVPLAMFNVCLSSMLNTRLDRFFSRWYTLVCVFVGIFWLMVSLQWKYFCLSSFKQCLCKLCSFCCSPALHVHALQKVMLLQLGQVVIQREILFLLFSEVVIQREVVFYSIRMGSFNGGWCRYKCIHPHISPHFSSNIYLILFVVCHKTKIDFATAIFKSGTSSSVARTRPCFLICEISKMSRVRSTFRKHVI